MKRLIALLLVLAMCLGMFAGCSKEVVEETEAPTETTTEPAETTPTEPAVDTSLEKALEYLRVFYKNAAEKTVMDYTRLGAVRIGTTTYPITWTVDADPELIQIVENEDGSVTIDINEETAKTLAEEVPYVLTATIVGTDGRELSLSWNHVVPAAIDEEAIETVKAAYALEPGQSLEGTHTLTGVIITVDTMYDSSYKNITVTIEVPGAEDMPIKCYRLKGEGADKLAVGDTITVTGTLTNYNGTIEFAQGCILEAVESGGGVPPTAPEDPIEILQAAFSLAPGRSLPYSCTLTGTITSVDYAYDANYGNITVTMNTYGYPVKCYRLKGAGVDQLNVNDVITVTGVLTNYNGTIEFGSGCLLVGLTNMEPPYEAPDPTPGISLTVAEAVAIGQKKAHNGYTQGKYYLTGVITQITSTTWGNMYISDGTGTILIYGTYSADGSVRYDGLAKKPVVGDTVTLYGIIGQYGGNSQMKNGWIVNHVPADGSEEEEKPSDIETSVDTNPAVGTAYKFGMAQGNLENQVYYLTGAMDGYYMATTTDATEAADVFLEETEGGYYFYAMVEDAKLYINMVVSGTHVNGAYEATPSTVYTYDSEKGTLVTDIDGAAYWFGTRNDKTFTTIGPCKVEYEGFYGQFYTIGESKPEEPTLAAPAVGSAYKFGMTQGNLENQVYYLTGAMDGYYMATTVDATAAVDVYVEEAEGGYYFYAMVEDAKLYINMVVSGTHVNGAFEAAASTVYTYDTEHATLIANVEGADYWFGTRNDKTFTTMGPCKVEYEGFYGQFYTMGASEEPEEPTDPEADSTLTIEEAIALALSKEHNVYTEGKYYVTGVITEIYNEQYGNMRITDEAGNILTLYGTFNADGTVKYADMEVKPVVGDTITIYGIIGQYNGTPQVKNGWIQEKAEEPEEPGLVIGAAYKFGMVQGNLENQVYYLTGAMDGYYMATTTDATAAVDVYVEEAEGGYYFYAMVDGAKLYINMVVSGTHVNGAFEAAASTVYTYDTEHATLIANVEGADYWFGTRNDKTYTTMGPCKVEFEGFYGQFYTMGASEEPEEPTDPEADSVLTIEEAIALALSKEHNVYTEGKYYVTGVITEIYNEQYGNMRIADEAGNILTLYGTFNADGTVKYADMEVKPVVGDTITIYGIIGQYNGTPQVKNGWIQEKAEEPEVPADPEADSVLTIEEAIALALSKEHNVYTEGKYYVTGVITEVYNTTYGNMRIMDEAGNILTIYGTYDATGDNRYDAMEVQPVAGDTVTIYGIIGQYNGTPQVKNGWIVAHTPADSGETEEPEEPEIPEEPEVPADPEADSVLTIEEAIALALSKEHNVYTEGKYYVTGVITEVYNTTYGNMRIMDEAGNILTIYGTYDATGANRYDAMEVQPVAGDTVTIYGIIGQYNGTPQVKNGWIVAHTPADSGETEEPEEPTEPEEPVLPEEGTTDEGAETETPGEGTESSDPVTEETTEENPADEGTAEENPPVEDTTEGEIPAENVPEETAP